MDKKTEALKLALEALEYYENPPGNFNALTASEKDMKALVALREALAEQPAQQEPVAWIYKPNMELLWPDEIEVKDPSKHRGYKPLYTAPQPAQQEPAVWTATRLWNRKDTWTCPADIEKDLLDGRAPQPAQPSKPWVGLKDEEKAEIKKQANYNWETTAGEYARKVQALTEAKLRELNEHREKNA